MSELNARVGKSYPTPCPRCKGQGWFSQHYGGSFGGEVRFTRAPCDCDAARALARKVANALAEQSSPPRLRGPFDAMPTCCPSEIRY